MAHRKNHYLPKAQTGFRKGCTTMDNVIRLETAVKIAFNNNRVTTAVFLDLSKAYDITWTNGLLYKLTTMDVKGPILKWLYNFLTERKIQVRVGNSLSDEMTMDKGVPQGSVLSPLLFNVMMSDFPQPEDDCDLSLFADDIELHTSTEMKKEAEPIIQDYLDRIEEWTYAWRLNFSVDKCAYVTFSRRRTQEPPINITLDGTNIKEVDQFKFLGITFDNKMKWDIHTQTLINSIRRKANFFKLLTRGKTILKPNLLIRIYKAMIRSKLDYGAIILSSITTSRAQELERAQNQILRIILGCFQSTPTPLLNIETGITPVAQRWDDLATRYLLKLSQKRWNPAYATIRTIVTSQRQWKPRATPAAATHLPRLNQLVKNLFNWDPVNEVQVNKFPPWTDMNTSTKFFPMSKDTATKQKELAREMFLTLTSNEPITHISVFTDGSVHKESGKTTCAFFIPKLEEKQSWLLTQHTSIFSAELTAIDEALRYLYSFSYEEVSIYTDSKAAILAIRNRKMDSSPVITTILDNMINHKSAGTKINFVWIPSHVGIQGNEIADQLATERRTAPTGGILKNPLTYVELCSLAKEQSKNNTLSNLKEKSTNLAVQSRTTIGLQPWIFRHKRAIYTKILRLRSGHNKLNHFIGKWDPNTDQHCPHGCPQTENAKHVLLECHAFKEERKTMETAFRQLNTPMELPSILGLNPNLPKSTQTRIIKHLIKFLTTTKLIDRV